MKYIKLFEQFEWDHPFGEDKTPMKAINEYHEIVLNSGEFHDVTPIGRGFDSVGFNFYTRENFKLRIVETDDYDLYIYYDKFALPHFLELDKPGTKVALDTAILLLKELEGI